MGKVRQFLKIETRELGDLVQIAQLPYPCRSK